MDSVAFVRLLSSRRLDADSIHHAVEACAPSLYARVDELAVAVWEPVLGLSAFLRGLAEDIRDWAGALLALSGP